jgi:Fe-S cluster assembly ATPase SufC
MCCWDYLGATLAYQNRDILGARTYSTDPELQDEPMSSLDVGLINTVTRTMRRVVDRTTEKSCIGKLSIIMISDTQKIINLKTSTYFEIAVHCTPQFP